MEHHPPVRTTAQYEADKAKGINRIGHPTRAGHFSYRGRVAYQDLQVGFWLDGQLFGTVDEVKLFIDCQDTSA